MKNLLSFVALALAFSSCIPPPPELCRRGVKLECERQFECQSDAVKTSEAFKGGWGTSVDDCIAKVSALAKCDEKTTENELCTGENAGKTFNVFKAADCSSARSALSCADFLDPAQEPAVCAERCK
ncbi:MAG: hypothetical protein K1X64_07940 [Myxococcaceae bacterium]|nr:hypothetical protein [Myxococcaceae bacterium]